jgi:hypothetical protein
VGSIPHRRPIPTLQAVNIRRQQVSPAVGKDINSQGIKGRRRISNNKQQAARGREYQVLSSHL